jgi:hypothetical protein
LHYNPISGELRWTVDRWAGSPPNLFKARAGDIAGYVETRGYLRVGIDGRVYKAHRIAWLIVEGRWPAAEIDHIDGNRTNNAWSNLRETDRRTNQENQRRARCDNQSGFLGVARCHKRKRKRWRAQIQVGGRNRHLGYHATPEEAHQAYLDAKRELHVGNTL